MLPRGRVLARLPSQPSRRRGHQRLNPGGNRQLNAALHRIAVAQARSHPPARAYLARRRQEGKSWKEALRALKRFILRAVWRRWQRCLQGEQPAPVAVAA
jgi:hypothetical protein